MGGVYVSERCGWIMLFLDFPLLTLWPPMEVTFIYHAYLWICGTAMYAFFGALVGIGLYGLRLAVSKQ